MKVDVVSDVTCPWCRIGLTNLRKAIGAYRSRDGEAVEVTLHPFLLDPMLPEEEGQGFRERLGERKGLDDDQVGAMFANVSRAGEGYGLTFAWDAITTAVNTVPVHALMMQVSGDEQLPLMLEIMEHYFEHGANVGDIDVLMGIVEKSDSAAGLDMDEIRQTLQMRSLDQDIREQVSATQASGIKGVPFFVFDGKVGLSGGQPPEVILQAMEQASAQT